MVGVLDSGVGGLSVVPALAQALPHAQLVIVADSGHAPYGERSDHWLQQRCAELASFLRDQGADMLVLACNTATAAAAAHLRAVHADWPIVGIEPGIKPARQLSRSGRIGVMATGGTLRSERYARLLREHGQDAVITAQACTGLAMAIEQGNETLIESLVMEHTHALRDAQVDVVVLGCTHYPFVRDMIQRVMGPDVVLLDTAQAVARRAASVLMTERAAPPAGASSPEPRFWTSGDPQALQRFAARWLGWSIKARLLPPR